MNRNSNRLILATAALGGLIAATAAFADTNTPSAPQATQGMMGDHGGSMNMMGGMSGDHMAQMSRMIDNCNRMMESASNPSRSDKAPDTRK